jgi:hypothetical protein
MAEITSLPYRPDPELCCDACVFGTKKHAEWCPKVSVFCPDCRRDLLADRRDREPVLRCPCGGVWKVLCLDPVTFLGEYHDATDD